MFFAIPFAIFFFMLDGSFARTAKSTVYKYKKYEKFDFEDLSIQGETGGPGDLSITPRYQKLYKNKLPYRKNFHAEIRKAMERIK